MNQTSQPIRRALCALMSLALLVAGLALPASAGATDTATVNAKVILRKAADKDSKALQTLPEGETVNLIELSGDWYKVGYGVYSGYILKKYLNVSKKSVVKNADKIEALGNAPGAMRVGDETSDVKKLQKALNILGYYKGSIDGKYGDGTTAAVLLYQQDQGLEADGVAGKATVKSIFGSCAKKSLSTQSDSTATAAATTTATTTKAASTASGKTVSSIAEIGSAPSATKEGDSGANVVKLQQALEVLGYYSGAIDGNYGAGTVAAVKKLQKNRGMKEDGIAGASTLRVLFGSQVKASASSSTASGKTYKTEVLDWFADNVSSVIPKNAKFTVKDVKTGKTFQCVRWSGVNHLDAEPRTASDTATMKSIYGGAWSWNRRAILVLYNGHVYAASMNGMPHGTTTISGNDFDGHFCIHFKNSKTHGTKLVDADHQKAVTAASKATW